MTHNRANGTPQLLQDIRGERKENPPMTMRTPEPTTINLRRDINAVWCTTGIFKHSRLDCVDMIVSYPLFRMPPEPPRCLIGPSRSFAVFMVVQWRKILLILI